MKKHWICFWLWILLIVPVQAKEISLGLAGGYFHPDTYDIADLDPAFGWSGHVSLKLTPHIQLGLAYMQARTQDIVEQDAILRSPSLALAYQFRPGFTIRPWVKTQVGYQWAQIDPISDTHGPEITLGFGTEYQIHDTPLGLILGFDYRMAWLKGLSSKNLQNYFVYVGANLTLGNVKRPKAAIPKQPSACMLNVPEGVALDEKGCPRDLDQDGVFDYEDLCPDTKTSKVDSMGCPVHHMARGVIEGLHFETQSARLPRTSQKKLSQITDALTLFPRLHLTIKTSTTDFEDIDQNQRLSKARARIIKNALIQKGFPHNQIKIIHAQDSNQPQTIDIQWQGPKTD